MSPDEEDPCLRGRVCRKVTKSAALSIYVLVEIDCPQPNSHREADSAALE